MANTQCKYLFKIIIVGNSGSGKSSLLLQYTRDKWTPYYEPTIGVDFGTKLVHVPDTNNKHIPIKLQLWDTAGQERFRTITTSYYKGACGVVIVFDLTNIDSFNAIPMWLDSVYDGCKPESVIILVGNKSDLPEERVVTESQINTLVEEYGLKYFETSAKDQVSTAIAFNIMAQDIFIKIKHLSILPTGVKLMYHSFDKKTIDINQPNNSRNRRIKCCK